jgi:hypothetical protein
MLLHVPPSSDLIIVEPGDQSASHSGSVGGLRIAGVQARESKQEPGEISEERLRPWIKALENLDLNW